MRLTLENTLEARSVFMKNVCFEGASSSRRVVDVLKEMSPNMIKGVHLLLDHVAPTRDSSMSTKIHLL